MSNGDRVDTPSGPKFSFPTRFRRRLTVAFVVIAGVASGLVAIGGYVFVDRQRHDVFLERANDQARFVYALTRGEESAARLDALIAVARERNGFETLVVADQTISSRSGLGAGQLPPSILDLSESGTSSAIVWLDGEPFLVIGGVVPASGSDARVYLFFSEREVREGLHDLRTGLIGGWIVVTLAAALVGGYVARRTLAPVRRSADAARSIAEDMLHTRLESGGRDEFGEWSHMFNEMVEALEAKIEELSAAHERERQFTADVAHDLRTPVAALVSASSLLRPKLEQLDPGTRLPVELMIADVDRLRKLVSDLLELGQAGSGIDGVRLEPVSLRQLVDRSIALCESPDTVEIRVADVAVDVDRVRLERVLFNLVRNAEVHGDGKIIVQATTNTTEIVIEVIDHGPGIPEDKLEHVFDRFRKADESRTKQGSGLGLAIVAQHVRVMGGTIEASNAGDGGAIFRVTLPTTEVVR